MGREYNETAKTSAIRQGKINIQKGYAGTINHRVPLILLLLEFSGYLPNSAVQPESALFSIRLAVGLIPALLLCGGLLFAALYPLKRVQFQTIVKDLETRRHSAASDD